MSNQLIVDARAALKARRAEVHHELRTLDEAIASLDKVLSAMPESQPEAREPETVSTPRAAGARPPLRELIPQILREHGAEMHGMEIVEELERRGYTEDMAKPLDAVWIAADRLRKTGEVVGLGRNRWALPEHATAEQDDPEAEDAPEPQQYV